LETIPRFDASFYNLELFVIRHVSTS
jgi:hypothetical protein